MSKIIKTVLTGYGTAARGLTQMLVQERERLWKEQGLVFQVVAVADSKGVALCPEGFLLDKLNTVKWDTGSVAHYPEWGQKGLTALEAVELSGAELLVECTPTNFVDAEPARSHILQGMALGMDVVMANKGPLALCWAEIHRAAEHYGRRLSYSCAAGCGLEVLPLVKSLGFSGELLRLRGMFNATSQYVLEQMAVGKDQAEAIRIAQQEGFAEADPSLDLGGMDTAVKLLIQSNAAWGGAKTIHEVEIEGIMSITAAQIAAAQSVGKHFCLVGEAVWNGTDYTMSVSPQVVDATDPLARVRFNDKVIQITTRSYGEQLLYGLNSSASGTPGALLKDMVALYRVK